MLITCRLFGELCVWIYCRGPTYSFRSFKKANYFTYSDLLVHGREAVWAHLKPILTEIKTKFPKIAKLEILIKEKEFGFDDIKWSFFEAGHGKGVLDAKGGAVKRRADNVLKYGGDITCAAIVFTTLSEDFNVKMYLVKEEWIEEERTLLNNIVLKPVSGTLNFHQVICDIKEGQITYRHLSCLCTIDSEHKGHEYVKAIIIDDA
ncbi:hypothetical protein MAR_005625, partial [Mya arenaria]